FVAKSKCTSRWPSRAAVYTNPLESGNHVICGTQPVQEMKAKERSDSWFRLRNFITEFVLGVVRAWSSRRSYDSADLNLFLGKRRRRVILSARNVHGAREIPIHGRPYYKWGVS